MTLDGNELCSFLPVKLCHVAQQQKEVKVLQIVVYDSMDLNVCANCATGIEIPHSNIHHLIGLKGEVQFLA